MILSEEPGARSHMPGEKRYKLISIEQFAYFFQLRHRTVTNPEFKVLDQDEIATTLFKRALSDIHEPRFISFRSFLKPFCDIRRDRDRSSP
jgi:hypothetical protein